MIIRKAGIEVFFQGFKSTAVPCLMEPKEFARVIQRPSLLSLKKRKRTKLQRNYSNGQEGLKPDPVLKCHKRSDRNGGEHAKSLVHTTTEKKNVSSQKHEIYETQKRLCKPPNTRDMTHLFFTRHRIKD